MSAPRSVRLSMRNGGRSWTGCAQWSVVVRVDNNREQQTRGVSAAALEARSTGTGASTRLSAAGGGLRAWRAAHRWGCARSRGVASREEQKQRRGGAGEDAMAPNDPTMGGRGHEGRA